MKNKVYFVIINNMQYNRVVQLASGTCIKIDNALSSRVKSITFELEKDKKYEDHFSVYNEREQELDGNVYSDNNRVSLKTRVLAGKSCDISFTIDATNMHDGDIIEGTIFIISNVGMLKIPYRYDIIANNTEKIINSLSTITDYYDYFNVDFDVARNLFSHRDFIKAPFMQDEFVMSLYEGLCKGSNINIAIIEFFKAFSIDITSFFATFDDEIVRRYIDDTLDNIDLEKVKSNEKLVEAISYGHSVLESEKITNELENEAIQIIESIEDRELLNVLASMCVRGNYRGEIAFRIYLKVVEKGSNISGIYDKFLVSIPESYPYQLPLYLYRYYYDDQKYSFEDKARLYENIIATFDEIDNVYKMYSAEIVEYAISRIYQNRITESLVKIYDKVLTTSIINDNNCNNILYLLRSHKVIVHNQSIRKAIIKYAETKKETKYDVINGIAYIPIFFDSYIMLYEDIYGNRFYNEPVDIKALFNRKELEKHIIENYPHKDIIDMTKIIKLNEAASLTKDYEVDEISELETKMDISIIIVNKFTKKIIDFYYNRCKENEIVTDGEKAYLKKFQFSKLDDEHKKKLLKVLFVAKEYTYVYDKVSIFGMELLDKSDLIILFSKCIDIGLEDNKNRLLNDMLSFVKAGNADPKICTYMSNYYEGSIDNMVEVLNSLTELNLDSNYMAKKILLNSLECNDSRFVDYAYDNYVYSEDEDINLQVAYLNKKATDYMLDSIDPGQSFFDKLSSYMGEHFADIDIDMPIIFLFAMTKYISTIKMLSNNEYRRILIKAMDRLLKTEYVFAYYKDINKHMRMPYSIMNKEYIEYHASKDFVPKAILSISGSDEKKELELAKMFMNIYVKKVTVFKNEIITYEIINSSDPSTGILASGTLVYDEKYDIEYPRNHKAKSTFDYVNDAIVCLDRDNIDGLKKVVMDMVEKQEISKGLFSI